MKKEVKLCVLSWVAEMWRVGGVERLPVPTRKSLKHIMFVPFSFSTTAAQSTSRYLSFKSKCARLHFAFCYSDLKCVARWGELRGESFPVQVKPFRVLWWRLREKKVSELTKSWHVELAHTPPPSALAQLWRSCTSFICSRPNVRQPTVQEPYCTILQRRSSELKKWI